jgi:hypothetical protein
MEDSLSPELEAAAEALYAAPLRTFVVERKRLADGLRAAGQRKAAAALLKMARPSLSAWVANQLFFRHRPDVDALFEAAARIREGALDATAVQRTTLSRLRVHAAQLLRSDEHAAAEHTVTRALTTLQAVAAVGSFAPDRPGRLLVDRDPPGFESMAAMSVPVAVTSTGRVTNHGEAGGLRASAPANMQASPLAGERAPSDGPFDDAKAVATRAVEQARAQAERARRERQEAERAEAARIAQLAKQRVQRVAELAQARRAAEHAHREVTHLRAKADELQTALQRVQQALAAAQMRAEAAGSAVADAETRLASLPR